jgi:hypothetical protein
MLSPQPLCIPQLVLTLMCANLTFLPTTIHNRIMYAHSGSLARHVAPSTRMKVTVGLCSYLPEAAQAVS